MNFPPDLMAGDILLYASNDLVDKVIEVKEGDDTAHIEVYAGGGKSWASRNGIGVNEYPFRPDGLKYVRRPAGTFVLPQAWFAAGVRGLPYGFGDILATLETRGSGENGTELAQLDGVDCSHFVAATLEVGGCPQFDAAFPKNKLTPRDFKLARASAEIFKEVRA